MNQWIYLILAAIAAMGLYGLNKHCKAKFGHAFISRNSTFIAVAGTLPIAIGQWCLDHMLGIAGWGFVAAGVAILCYLVYANVRGTNLWYGLGGSVVQIPLLLIASEFIIALAIVGLALWVILSLFGLSAGDSSSISDQQEQEDHDWFMSLNNKDGFWKDKGKS